MVCLHLCNQMVWLDWIVVVYLGLVVYSFLVLGGGNKSIKMTVP